MNHTTISNCVRSLTLAALLSAGAIHAADFYAAPTGVSTASGTIGSPWDLPTALSGAAGRIHPGDNVWLRGGTYRPPNSNGFDSTLLGTVSAPIVVRNYPGERVTLDGKGCEFVIAVDGGYTWFWGLEITDSSTTRSINQGGEISPNAFGVAVFAPGTRFINNIVHDTGEGFSAYNLSNDSVFNGNISYYNGWMGTDRNHGHGFYMQNITGTKFLVDNFAFDNADEGFQIYGSGSANVVGFRLFGNVSANNSSWPYPNFQYNYIIAGGAVRRDIQIDQNHSFLTPSANYGFNTFGQYTTGDDMSITNNVFVGGYGGPEVNCQGGPIVFTGNKSYVQPGALYQMKMELCPGQSTTGWTWDNNTYYGKTNFYNDSSMVDFVSWQLSRGFDKHSTMNPNAPTGKWIYVRPNQYESKRANIVIYNWDLSGTVAVDLSGVLAVGDPYVIHDAQNFFGTSVASGTYSGTPVSIPMTGLTKAPPTGFAAPAHTAPLFGTFIVTSSNSTAGVSVSVTPGAANLLANQQQQFTASVQGNSNQSVSWTLAGPGSISSTGLYTGPASVSGTTTATVTATSVADSTKSGNAGVTLTPAASTSVSVPQTSVTAGKAQFVKVDATTQGTWKGVYGGDGAVVVGDTTQLPSYVSSVTPNAQSFWTWLGSTTEDRGLQKLSASDRIEATWYSGTTFTVDLNLTDTSPHQVAFYSLDWENAGRAETVDILDAATGTLLDSQTLSSFWTGKYLVWNLTGHVTVRFTRTGSLNTVLDGIFFGGGATSTPVIPPVNTGGTTTTNPPTAVAGNTAQFVKFDTTTAGSWKGVYGADGYTFVADSAKLPSYATVTPGSQLQWTWAASTTDPRGLQQGTGTSRIDATWYSPDTFTVDVNITDGQAHSVAFYCLDFENAGRAQNVTIYDATTNAVLDSRNLAAFSNGQYMVWNLSGHVIVRFTERAETMPLRAESSSTKKTWTIKKVRMIDGRRHSFAPAHSTGRPKECGLTATP